MSNSKVSFSAFTKPWRTQSVTELAKLISGFGFDGIEFPLRDGYQLEPAKADKLPQLAQQLGEYGLKIFSVASSTDERVFAGCADERVFAGCAEAGIPMIRIMPEISHELGYLASEEKIQQQLEALLPLCEKYGVKIGCQQHHGNQVVDSMGLLHLLEKFNPDYIGAVWDAAHDALAGQQPEFGLDIVWSHLCMVNLKNVFYLRANGPEALFAKWTRYFTTGPNGLASWPRVVHYLQQRNYEGVVCLTAQYEAEHEVDRLIAQDLVYAKSLFN